MNLVFPRACRGFYKEFYTQEEIYPLVEYLTNGRKKSFLYPSAVVYLRVPEMMLPLTDIHMPSFNLEYAFSDTQVRFFSSVVPPQDRIFEYALSKQAGMHFQSAPSERVTPPSPPTTFLCDLLTTNSLSQEHSSYPCIVIVDQESLLSNSKDKLENLREVGVFGLEKEGLQIIRDNHLEHHGHHHHFRKDFDAIAVVTPVPTVPYKTFDLIDLSDRRSVAGDFAEQRASRIPPNFKSIWARDFAEQRTKPYVDFATNYKPTYAFAAPLSHDFTEQGATDFGKNRKYVAAPLSRRTQPYIDFTEHGDSPYSVAAPGYIQDDAHDYDLW